MQKGDWGGNYRNEILDEWRVNGEQSISGRSSFGQKQDASVGAASVEARDEDADAGGLLDCSVARRKATHASASILRLEEEA